MSYEDWLKDKGEIYLDYTFDETKRKWNGRIVSYKGHIVLHETKGHGDEEDVKDALKPVFDKFIKELEDGRKVKDLQSV